MAESCPVSGVAVSWFPSLPALTQRAARVPAEHALCTSYLETHFRCRWSRQEKETLGVWWQERRHSSVWQQGRRKRRTEGWKKCWRSQLLDLKTLLQKEKVTLHQNCRFRSWVQLFKTPPSDGSPDLLKSRCLTLPRLLPASLQWRGGSAEHSQKESASSLKLARGSEQGGSGSGEPAKVTEQWPAGACPPNLCFGNGEAPEFLCPPQLSKNEALLGWRWGSMF